jgi:hypothetical protein
MGLGLDEIGAIAEIVSAVMMIPFVYLTWASGYMHLLVQMARKRGWGLRPPPDDSGDILEGL